MTTKERQQLEERVAECERRAERSDRKYGAAHWYARSMGVADALAILRGEDPDKEPT